MILIVFIFLLETTVVSSEIAWKKCDDDTGDVDILNVTVTPYPVKIPGEVSVQVGVRNRDPFTAPVKVSLNLKKKMLFGGVHIPCVQGIGSCVYDDLCQLCDQCSCPIESGDHVLSHSIHIFTDNWAFLGNYLAEVIVEASNRRRVCAEIRNIHIVSAS